MINTSLPFAESIIVDVLLVVNQVSVSLHTLHALHTLLWLAKVMPNRLKQRLPGDPGWRQGRTQDMSEYDFRFFESEWGLYRRATGVKNQALVDELWSCMSNLLKKLAFDQGDIENLLTEELMMTRIKSLAVAVLHTAIHTVRLHEATQVPLRPSPPGCVASPLIVC